MTKKELRKSLDHVLGHAISARCEHLHHKCGEYHNASIQCPVVRRLKADAKKLQDNKKALGL